MLCIFHRYSAIEVQHLYDTSLGLRRPSTYAVMQCQKCGRLKGKYLYGMGFRTVQEINLGRALKTKEQS